MGVAHRDIKPENLLLDGRGSIKVCSSSIYLHTILPNYRLQILVFQMYSECAGRRKLT